jgi:hypothetical protein
MHYLVGFRVPLNSRIHDENTRIGALIALLKFAPANLDQSVAAQESDTPVAAFRSRAEAK